MRRRLALLVLPLALVTMAVAAPAASATVRIVATVAAPLEVYVNSPGASANETFPEAIPGGTLSKSGNTYTFTDTDYATGIVDSNLGEPTLGLTVCYPPSASGRKTASYSVSWYDRNPGTGDPEKHTIQGSLSTPGRSVGIGYATEGECAARGTAAASAPVARCDAYWVPPGGLLKVPAPGFLKNDSDPKGLKLTAKVDQINFGVSGHPYTYVGKTGKLEFRPNKTPGGKPFIAEIEYHVTNSKGRKSKPATIRIYIQRTKPPASKLKGCAGKLANPCGSGEASDHLYTTLEGVAEKEIDNAPNPDFGVFSMGVRWCTGSAGAVIKSTPSALATLSTTWLYLGLLESLGFAPEVGRTEVEVDGPHVTASAPFDLRFSPAEVALNVLPTDKAFVAVAKALKEYKLAVKAGKTKPAVLLAKFKNEVIEILDKKVGNAIEKYVARALSKIPSVSDEKAEKIADKLDDVLEKLTGHYAVKLAEKGAQAAVKSLFKQIFAKVSLPVWKVKVTVTVHENGKATYTNDSSSWLFKQSWKIKTVT